MKKVLLYSFMLLSVFSFSQALTEGYRFYDADSTFYYEFNRDRFTFHERNGKPLFSENYAFPVELVSGVFRCTNSKNQYEILAPKTNFRFQLDTAWQALYPNDIPTFVVSSLLGDTLIKLNGLILLDRNNYYIGSDEGYEFQFDEITKKYTLYPSFYAEALDLQKNYPEDLSQSPIHQMLLGRIHPSIKMAIFDKISDNYNDEVSIQSDLPKVYEQFFCVKKEGKWGVYSSFGKTIIPCKYASIETIFMEHLMPFREEYFYFEAKEGKNYLHFNHKGEPRLTTKLSFYDNYLDPYGNVDLPYAQAIHLRNKGKVGLMSIQGDTIVPPIFRNYDFFGFNHEDRLYLGKNATKGFYIGMGEKNWHFFYNEQGQFLDKIQLDAIYQTHPKGFVLVEQQFKQSILNAQAKLAFPFEYDLLEFVPGTKEILVGVSETFYGFLDFSGKKINTTSFDKIQLLDSTRALVRLNGKEGVLHLESLGKELTYAVPLIYDSLLLVENSDGFLFIGQLNGKQGVINQDGETIVSFDYTKLKYAYTRNVGRFFIYEKNSKLGMVNLYSKIILPNEYDYISIVDCYQMNLILQKQGKVAIWNGVSSVSPIDFVYDKVELYSVSSHCFYKVILNGKMGLLDQHQKRIIDSNYVSIQYDAISNEFECRKEDKTLDCIPYK